MLRLLACALALSACAAPSGGNLDPALSRHLATVEAGTMVDVLVGLAADAPQTAPEALADAGLEVRTAAGDVVIARGTGDAIERAAALPWVEHVALSQDRSPLTEPAR